ncbi:hypothetical protein GCM10017744_102910 [Streptomyces antimycoticus]|uniref:Uncharacterized protein n=1 Tax=Streptomyces antimycoticus TaxID=68175 RepID=A0A4D4KK43_9ACTN|nr:hypothetical protein [Streptomyces antimycoticus]GDY49325.1 hypothetical protein SANT12839_102070 [Streptomyces antimycoticus]
MTDPILRRDLRIAEDEVRVFRGFKATVVAFIHDTAHDPEARRSLAERLGLPPPRTATSALPQDSRPDDTSQRTTRKSPQEPE